VPAGLREPLHRACVLATPHAAERDNVIKIRRNPIARAQPVRNSLMHKILLIGLGLCAAGAFFRIEEEHEDGAGLMAPFLAALALEAGIFLLRRHQTLLLQKGPNP